MKQTSRLASIDCFRGFAVLAMVLATYLTGTEELPAWLRHAPDGELTVVDLGAPFFIIAIGLTFGRALQRRWARDGPSRALWHFLRRALLLFVTILTFHDVGEPAPGANPAERGNAISEAFFEQILQWLKANDVRVVTVAEGCRMLRAARGK